MIFTITTYDASDALIDTNDTADVDSILIQLNIGPAAINAAFPGMIDDSVAFYTVEDDNGHLITVNLNICSKYPSPVHLVFLNRLGGFESAWFRGKNRNSADIDRKTFGSNEYRIQTFAEISEPIAMTLPSEGFTNNLLPNSRTYATTKKYKWNLSTHLLTDAEFEWLAELVASPVVYMEKFYDGEAFYIPMRITNTNYEYKRQTNDKLNPLEVELEVLRTFNTQFA